MCVDVSGVYSKTATCLCGRPCPKTFQNTQKTAFYASVVRPVWQAWAYTVPAADVEEAVVAARIAAIRAVTAAGSDGFIRF